MEVNVRGNLGQALIYHQPLFSLTSTTDESRQNIEYQDRGRDQQRCRPR